MSNEERLRQVAYQIEESGIRPYDEAGYCSWEAAIVVGVLGGVCYEFYGPVYFRRWDRRENSNTYFLSQDKHVIALLDDGVVVDLGNWPQVYSDIDSYLNSARLFILARLICSLGISLN